MNKNEFLKMMYEDNETQTEPQKSSNADVIECMYLALSQTEDSIDIDHKKNIKNGFALIEKRAKERKTNCVGPFEAAEILAEYLCTTYIRPSKMLEKEVKRPIRKVNIDDFM